MSTTSGDDVKTGKFWMALIAEFLGTLLLVLVGCGSCAKLDPTQPTDVVQISLAFGLSVATIVWVIAHVSGGHINPGITIGFFVTRKISAIRTLFYIIVQTVGAIAGAAILKGVSVAGSNDSLGTPMPASGVTSQQVFAIELCITFVLVITVFATCDSLRSGIGGSGPLAIGLSLTMCHLWAVPYTGSSMNPARGFGPAVVSGKWQLTNDYFSIHAAYWLGPLLGGILAGLIYDLLFATNASIEKAKSLLSEKDYEDSKFDEQGRRASIQTTATATASDPLKDTSSVPDQGYGTLH